MPLQEKVEGELHTKMFVKKIIIISGNNNKTKLCYNLRIFLFPTLNWY